MNPTCQKKEGLLMSAGELVQEPAHFQAHGWTVPSLFH